MALHRELFKDLPPVEELRKDYARALAQKNNADGFYNLVQLIAEKYGEGAFALAEEIFKEMGLDFDPADLHTPDLVRRIGYNFEGINIYAIQVKAYAPEVAAELVRLYNEQIRRISYTALSDAASFAADIAGKGSLLVACQEGGQPVGFVHCLVEDGQGSVEMLIFGSGRIYDPVGKALVKAARAYFAAQGIATPVALAGMIAYPFYTVVSGKQMEAFEQHLAHIAGAIREIVD